MNWKGKVVFLTGASSGIGNEMALQLARKGATLGLLARRREELEKLKTAIEKEGGVARVFSVDVIDKEGLEKSAESLRNEFGKIDVMIANAGIGGGAVHAKDLSLETFSKVINVNVFGALNSLTAVLPDMIEKNSGQIVVISSLAGSRGLPKSASYSASKAAVNNLFESVRLDLLNTNIDVTIIQPGFIKTPLTSGREANMPFLMELDAATAKMISAIEKRKKFFAFPWQLASFVKLARIFPGWLYDKIAGSRNYRE
jgi:short-subunit dehydrogenase